MTVDHKFSNTTASSVLELLQSNAKFIVPKFQRNYSWDVEKVEALWSDLFENFLISRDEPEQTQETQYLLGPVVLVRGEGPGEFLVIDGQQRLSTLTILFCVARDIIRENVETSKNTKPDGIEKITEMIENTRMGAHAGWKLELNDTDRELFRQIQEYEEDSEPQYERISKLKVKPKSKQYLKASYQFLHKKIVESLCTNFSSDVKKQNAVNEMNSEEKKSLIVRNVSMLIYFLTHVRENNFVVKIMVSDDATAYQIFETLNERGQTLSKSNLIKNHILNQVRDKTEQKHLSDRWNDIFDKIIGKQRDDEFIMESFRSRHFDTILPISRKNLYKIIKAKITNNRTCKKYIRDLEEDANFLSTLNEPDTYSDESTQEDVYAIKTLGAKFIRTPILAAHRIWGENKDYRRLLKFLVKFFFKFRVVRQKHPSDVEAIMMRVTQMIVEKNSLNKIIRELKQNDDHANFLYNFQVTFVPSPGKDAAKYVLQKITMCLGTPYDDVQPIDNLTLEHILPQDTHYWNDDEFFIAHDRTKKIDYFISHLGNLTLLNRAVNTKIQNHRFENKKTCTDAQGREIGYKSSQLKINTDTVCNQDTWTAKIIDDRGKYFSELAGKIWKP